MPLSNRQRLFVEEYLQCWNGSEAARRAGYTGKPNVIGPRLLAKDSIQALIKQRLDQSAMTADETLQRLAQHARGDMGDFLDISSMGFTVDLAKAQEKGITRLIKRVDLRTETSTKSDGTEVEIHNMKIELYDAQNALVQLAKHHGLIIDRHDMTTGGKPIEIPNERFDRAVSTLADVIRESLHGADSQPDGALDATEQTPMAGAPNEGG